MSEYQHYEFAAIDRPFSRAQMAELGAVSTRAVISLSAAAPAFGEVQSRRQSGLELSGPAVAKA